MIKHIIQQQLNCNKNIVTDILIVYYKFITTLKNIECNIIYIIYGLPFGF